MTDASGGVASASGLRFQYLVAIAAALTELERSDADFELRTEDPRSEVIDFAIVANGRYLLSAQAKSSIDDERGRAIGFGELDDIFRKLCGVRAERWEVVTNRRLTAEAAEHLGQAQQALGASGSTAILEVVQDGRANGALAAELVTRLRTYRRDRSYGGGHAAAGITLARLVEALLRISGQRGHRTLTRADLEALIATPVTVMGHLTGGFDYGTLLGDPPMITAVHRWGPLSDLAAALAEPREARRPRRIALTGFSGAGKSALAATIATERGAQYERLLWVDASSSASLRRQLGPLVAADNTDSDDDVRTRWRMLVSASADEWLIVLDNATDAAAIAPWVPLQGSADIIATSTSATGWDAWQQHLIAAMEDDEAVELVRVRLGLDELDDKQRATARQLVDGVGCWPLAIELACAHLRASSSGLAVTDDYLRALRGTLINSPRHAPTAYRDRPTLLQAVQLALDGIEHRADANSTVTAAGLLATLAFLPAKSAPLRLAGHAAWDVARNVTDAHASDVPSADVDVEIDAAAAELHAASLTTPTGTTARVRVNEIVLYVAQAQQEQPEQQQRLAALQSRLLDAVTTGDDSAQLQALTEHETTSTYVLKHAARTDALTTAGTLLLGNHIDMWGMRGETELAIDTSKIVLDLLADEPRQLANYARTHAGLALWMTHAGRDDDEVYAQIDTSVRVVELLYSIDAEHRALQDVANRLTDLISATAARVGKSQAAQGWHDRLDAIADTTQAHRFAGLSRALSQVDNDDEATLKTLLDSLEGPLSSFLRVQIRFRIAETLMHLERPVDAATALEEACDDAERSSMPLSAAHSSLTNIWRSAVLTFLANGEDEGRRALATRIDELLRETRPPSPHDKRLTDLLHLATWIEHASVDTLAPLVEGFDGFDFTSTLLTPDVTGAKLIQAACRSIFDLRARVGGAPLYLAQGFAPTLTPFGQAIALVATDTEPVPGPSEPSAWIHHSLGTGLLIQEPEPMIIMMSAALTGWLVDPNFEVPNDAHRQLVELVDLTRTHQRPLLVGIVNDVDAAPPMPRYYIESVHDLR